MIPYEQNWRILCSAEYVSHRRVHTALTRERAGQIPGDREQSCGCPGPGGCLTGAELQQGKMKRVLEQDSGDSSLNATLPRAQGGHRGDFFVYVATFFKKPVSSALLPGKKWLHLWRKQMDLDTLGKGKGAVFRFPCCLGSPSR